MKDRCSGPPGVAELWAGEVASLAQPCTATPAARSRPVEGAATQLPSGNGISTVALPTSSSSGSRPSRCIGARCFAMQRTGAGR